MQHILVTGGAGFIGSAFIRFVLRDPSRSSRIVNYDALTYAANLENLSGFENHPRYLFIQGNILNQPLVEKILLEQEIDTIVHFAAETHVDRSIASAQPFIETNVSGTLALLEAVRKFPHVHFHHISTDEVYGALGEGGTFNEHSHYRPNSPYAASKAASDHLVRAFAHTYNLSTTISHCGNNYGPGQHPEKLIPLMILHCLQNKPLPVYGKGNQVRDWIFVDDHVAAIWEILKVKKRGETYDIGGDGVELTNLELLHVLLKLLSEHTKQPLEHYMSLIHFVTDRPGHDFRYAVDATKIEQELGWRPTVPLSLGLKRTIHWYLNFSRDK